MLHRIMLIDDDEDDREFFCYCIQQIDPSIEVICFVNGSEAISLLGKDASSLPQIIFLDVNMPGLDGKETLVRLKKISGLKDVPIIIYSTSSNGKEEMLALGAAHVVVKPHRLKMVVEELTRIINLYR